MDVERDKTYFPVPRHIHLYSIEKVTNFYIFDIIIILFLIKGLNLLFGQGKKRIMRPGEEAAIISAIEKFL